MEPNLPDVLPQFPARWNLFSLMPAFEDSPERQKAAGYHEKTKQYSVIAIFFAVIGACVFYLTDLIWASPVFMLGEIAAFHQIKKQVLDMEGLLPYYRPAY